MPKTVTITLDRDDLYSLLKTLEDAGLPSLTTPAETDHAIAQLREAYKTSHRSA